MKKVLTAALSLIMLTSCSKADSSSLPAETTTTTETSASETVVLRPEKKKDTFTAKIIGYSGGSLTYEYEGSRQSIPLAPEGFLNDQSGTSAGEMLSLKIINNPYGCKITGVIMLDSREGKNTCDVISPNIELFTGSTLFYDVSDPDATGTPDDFEVSMKRLGGSRAVFFNQYGSVEADLNDLDNLFKLDFPEEAELVDILGWRLPDGHIILDKIGFFESKTEDGYIHFSPNNSDKYRFFGTVQSITDTAPPFFSPTARPSAMSRRTSMTVR